MAVSRLIPVRGGGTVIGVEAGSGPGFSVSGGVIMAAVASVASLRGVLADEVAGCLAAGEGAVAAAGVPLVAVGSL